MARRQMGSPSVGFPVAVPAVGILRRNKRPGSAVSNLTPKRVNDGFAPSCRPPLFPAPSKRPSRRQTALVQHGRHRLGRKRAQTGSHSHPDQPRRGRRGVGGIITTSPGHFIWARSLCGNGQMKKGIGWLYMGDLGLAEVHCVGLIRPGIQGGLEGLKESFLILRVMRVVCLGPAKCFVAFAQPPSPCFRF